MPHSVEMPAPVNGTTTSACLHHLPQPGDAGLKIGRDHAILSLSPGAGQYRFQAEATEEVTMRFLHTMLRVRNLDAALNFYVNLLGLQEVRRRVDDKNKYTLVFLAAPEDVAGRQGRARRRPPRRALRRADLQLGHRGLRRGALLRPSRLRGRRHLRDLREAAEGRRHHQPAAARRQHGVRPLARQAFDRASAEGQAASRRRSPGPRCRTPGKW